MYKILFNIIIITLSIVNLKCELYDDRPKIRTQDGDLYLESAYGKNIYLQTRGPKSTIFLGNVDTALMNVSSKENSPGREDTPVPTFQLSGIRRRLDRVERTVRNFRQSSNVSQLTRRISRVENQLLNLRTQFRDLRNNKCASRPCLHGGTCLNLATDYHCLCPDNWEGRDCDVDVNECRNFAGTDLGCQNGATCLNRDGSYECLCRKGWYGLHCTRKSMDCLGGDREMCGHGVCVQVVTDHGIKCICDQGWTTNATGPVCDTDVDECADGHRCSINPRVQCFNTPGSYRCGDCPTGYQGDGHACYDIDECAIDNGGCSTTPRVACYNTLGSRMCGPCPAGYEGDGVACVWRGSCAIQRGGCHPAATCVESSGVALCMCPVGMRGTGVGPDGCYVLADNSTCESRPCGAHGRCHPLSHGYTCFCDEGYGGAHCETPLQYCASNPCLNGGTCRADAVRGFRCECTSQHSGDLCQLAARVCGGVLDAPEGSIVYPFANSSRYGHNSRCAWVIHTAANKVINVTFTKFDIEYIEDCAYDFLQIHDGRSSASQLIGRFCGKEFPRGGNIISSHNNLYFWFRSDLTVAKEGFALHWTSVDPVCGGDLNASTHGNINSPGWPGKYPPNRDCYWHLRAPSGKRIQLHFFQLNIESHDNCSYDYLALYDGTRVTDPLINKYCKSDLPAPVQSSGSELLIYFHSDALDSGNGFQISYASVEGVPGCGGLFTSDKGEITSPSYNGRYLSNLVCDYQIKTQPGAKIRLNFVSFKLERSFGCRYDYISVYDGLSSDANFVGKFCGTTYPKNYLSNTNTITIKFKSDRSLSEEGFKIKYETVCHQIIVGDTGVISSPNYPNEYPANKFCEYIISTSVGKAIQLTFQDFDIEDNNYYDCQYDYVEIRDGPDKNSTVLGHYCGGTTHTPPPITSTHNYMYVVFNSDMSLSGSGFLANYTTIDVRCGGIYKDATGLINYPSDSASMYANDESCTWLIIAPPGNYIKLMWNRFDVEDMSGCLSDYVEINEIDDNNEVNHFGKFCGTSSPPAITVTTNRLQLKFESDGTVQASGFSVSYAFLDSTTHCGGTFSKPSGRIRSPGWPKPYDLNRDCVWVITVPFGQQITLNISSFDLESPIGGKCDYGDFLEMRNGASMNSPLIGRFCGINIPRRMTSLGNSLHIYFHSDFYLGGDGFEIEWDGSVRGCGGTLTQESGSITSPNYPQNYDDNAECFYKVITSPGSRITISFTVLDLEVTKDCRDDYVEIFDGRDSNAQSLGKYCRWSSDTFNIRTTSNMAFIKFRSDILIGGKGFCLTYNNLCENNITGSYGVIESPNYPEFYPNNLNCIWTITVPRGNRINVTFTHFDITKSTLRLWQMRNRSSDDCADDYLQIKDGDSSSYNKLCGSITPNKITSKSNVLVIKFVSASHMMRTGFRLEWVKDGCGGTLLKDYGIVELARGKLSMTGAVECEWYIETTPGTAIKITFSNVYMKESKNCTTDAIEIYDGPNTRAPLSTKICRRGISIYQSSTNLMTIKLVKQSNYRDLSFVGIYETTKGKCGGMLLSLSGIIYSPNYPKNYENNMDCVWYLTVPTNHVIEFNILDLDLYSADDISSYEKDSDVPHNSCGDSIRLYDNARILGSNYTHQICPYSHTKQIISRSNNLNVQFVSDSSGTAKGFKANFSVTCGAVIKVKTDGILTNDLLSVQHSNRSCVWTLIAQRTERRISFTLTHLSLPKLYSTSNRLCPTSYLRVYDGNDVEAPLIKEFCGNKISPMIVSKGNAMTVELGSHADTIEGTFTAHYTTLDSACGGTLTSEEGSLASPNYPYSYPAPISCEWILNTSPGNKVYLSFETFDLEYSENCNEDYLEIRENNGGGRLLGVYCGNEVPINTTISHRLYIKLHTDTKGSAGGFLAHYGFIHGNSIEGLERGEIASPLYPNPYLGPGDYSWRILAYGTQKIIITFLKIEIDNPDADCSSYLSVHDGFDETTPLLEQFCGLMEGYSKVLQTTSSIAYIHLKLSERNTGSLFHAEWSKDSTNIEINENNINCGSNNTTYIRLGEAYKFESPTNADGTYDNLQNCEWVFRTDQGQHLKIWFESFELEQTTGCINDYVSIYSSKTGGDDWKTIREHMCENPGVIVDKYINNIKINFTSDSSLNFPGFRGFVSAECGGRLTDLSGVIEMRSECWNHSLTAINYDWTVKVRPGRTIGVTFEHFNITNHGDHCVNYVKLYNGESKESPILGNGKYCGFPHEARTEAIITSANALHVSYHYETVIFNNFKIRYEEVDVECGVTSKLDSAHPWELIGTPNYPSVPNPYTECVWIFTAPPGEVLRIDFINRFDLERDGDCTKEYVELRDGASDSSPLKGRYCQSAPATIKTTNNAMYIKYSTAIAEPRNGFQANISICVCGGTIIASEGELLSPGYPHMPILPAGTVCEWKLKGLYHGHVFRIKPLDISLPDSDNFCGFKIVIEEVLAMNSTTNTLKTFCDSDTDIDGTIDTFTSEVYFKLIIGQRSETSHISDFHGFRFKFSSAAPSCGETITAAEGFISTPGYPRETSIRYCQWLITSPNHSRRVKLEFIDSEFNAEIHRIGIFNDHSFRSVIKNIPSRDWTPAQTVFRSSGHKLAVYLWIAPSANQHRFKARYTTDETSICGSPDMDDDNAVISSPNTNDSFYCDWRYRAKRSDSENLYKTLYVKLKINTSSSETRCRFSDPKFNIKANVARTLPFIRAICWNEEKAFRIPSLDVEFKALRAKDTLFEFHVEVMKQPCGGTVTVGETSADILNLPKNHNGSLDCGWIINIPPGRRAEFHLEGQFNLPCADEFLKLSNNLLWSQTHTEIGDYCKDRSPPQTISVYYRSLYLQYHNIDYKNSTNINLVAKTVSSPCGGQIINKFDRTFSSPNYPKRYNENQECSWEIDADVGNRVQLRFIDRFVIEDKPNCTSDSVTIYDWKDDEYVQIGKVCGRQIPSDFNSTSHKMKVVFRSDAQNNLDGFKAKWTPICGGDYLATTKTQYIYSPGYPNEYSKRLDCNYQIKADGEGKLKIKFLEFELEGKYPSCNYDNVTIKTHSLYETSWDTYCGKTKPPDKTATTNIEISFKTDSFLQAKGFKLSYEIFICEKVIKDPTVITINNGAKYDDNQNCTWTIEAPPDKVIIVKFDFIDIEETYECYNDYLAVYEGFNIIPDKRIALLCGHINSTTVLRSISNKMLLQFVSDYSQTYGGFKAHVFFSYAKTVGCGGDINLLNKAKDKIKSPLLNNNVVYENYMDCLWTIKTGRDKVIQVEFKSFHISPCENVNQTALGFTKCHCDYVEIRDGLNPNSLLIGKYCGHSLPPVISSSGQFMSLRFHTDGEIASSGFELDLTTRESECGKTVYHINNTITKFTSPGFESGNIPRGLHCTYYIYPEVDYPMNRITIKSLDLLPENHQNNECTDDKLIITNARHKSNETYGVNFTLNLQRDSFLSQPYGYNFGYDLKYPKTFTFCGIRKSVDLYVYGAAKINIQTSSNALTTRSQKYKGFEIETSMVNWCARNYTEPQGRIQNSHTYLSDGSDETDCYTTIIAPENHTISLYFFTLYGAYWNDKVFIKFYDGDSTKSSLLRTSRNAYAEEMPIFSSGRYITIHNVRTQTDVIVFDSNYVTTDKGKGCGGYIDNVIGIVTSPMYPNVYREVKTCEWILQTPVGTKLLLHFKVFDLGKNCEHNYIELVDKNGVVFSMYCEEPPANYQSPDNYVKIVSKTSLNNVGTGWVAEYITVE